ncbi:MAG: hypothetical protein JST48_08835 [Bacteroidetes bacterium]|nr:hypothetical protein [Bacteroidota bacterium]
MNRNVYRVEFDDEFLYLILKKNDILIPLENIKDINISTLGGIWRVDLYNAEQIGNKFYFKPSLLYPFNAKKKDELVNVLWEKINKGKSKAIGLPKKRATFVVHSITTSLAKSTALNRIDSCRAFCFVESHFADTSTK